MATSKKTATEAAAPAAKKTPSKAATAEKKAPTAQKKASAPAKDKAKVAAAPQVDASAEILAASEQRAQTAQDRADKAEGAIADLRKEIDTVRGERDDLLKKIADLERQRDESGSDLAGLRGERDALHTKVAALSAEQEGANARADAALRTSVDLEGQVRAAKDEALHAHKNRCPKCGKHFFEERFEGITIDRCSGCEAVYFDAGEVEQLIQKVSQPQKPGFWSGLFKRKSKADDERGPGPSL
jgi:Zn-finger nucleic acid-binding protein/chromosome segregation ATPase